MTKRDRSVQNGKEQYNEINRQEIMSRLFHSSEADLLETFTSSKCNYSAGYAGMKGGTKGVPFKAW